MEFDLNECREKLNSSDVEASIALRVAVDAIPRSLPLLPTLYAKHRSTSNPALRSWTFASIARFKELAIPFILELLDCDDHTRDVMASTCWYMDTDQRFGLSIHRYLTAHLLNPSGANTI